MEPESKRPELRRPHLKDNSAPDNVEHKISAYFSSDGEKYLPVMDCSCGFETGRQDSFAEAGELIDEHLETLA